MKSKKQSKTPKNKGSTKTSKNAPKGVKSALILTKEQKSEARYKEQFYEGLTESQKNYTWHFLRLDNSLTYREKVEEIATKFKKSIGGIYQMGKKLEWQQLAMKYKAETKAKELEQKVTEEQQSDRYFNRSSFTQIAETLRDVTGLSLSLLSGNLAHAHRMSQLYSTLIDKEIQDAGGIDRLTEQQLLTIAVYEKKLNGYKEELRFVISPSQISQNLKMLGLQDDLANLNVDSEKMTPEYIQKQLIELIQQNHKPEPSFEEMLKDVYYNQDLPNIDARLEPQPEIKRSPKKKENE